MQLFSAIGSDKPTGRYLLSTKRTDRHDKLLNIRSVSQLKSQIFPLGVPQEEKLAERRVNTGLKSARWEEAGF